MTFIFISCCVLSLALIVSLVQVIVSDGSRERKVTVRPYERKGGTSMDKQEDILPFSTPKIFVGGVADRTSTQDLIVSSSFLSTHSESHHHHHPPPPPPSTATTTNPNTAAAAFAAAVAAAAAAAAATQRRRSRNSCCFFVLERAAAGVRVVRKLWTSEVA